MPTIDKHAAPFASTPPSYLGPSASSFSGHSVSKEDKKSFQNTLHTLHDPLSSEKFSHKSHSLETGLYAFHSKKTTKEEADKAAQDVLSSFYTQLFKEMMEGFKSEEENGETTFQDMTTDFLAESAGKALGRKPSPTLEKISQSILKRSGAEDIKAEISPQKEEALQQFQNKGEDHV